MKNVSRSSSYESRSGPDESRFVWLAREAGTQDVSIHLRQWMREGLQDLPRDSSILALGCDQAFLAPQLTEYSAEVTVLDTSAAQIAQLAPRFPEINFLQHTVSRALPFPHSSFEAIWCCEFLDRVFDPEAALRELLRVLVPGGRLLVTVPDHGPVRQLLNTLFKRENSAAAGVPRIRHFTRSSLALIAYESGLTEIQVVSAGSNRKMATPLVPRSLLLAAKKGPGVQLLPATERHEEMTESSLWDELALAGRSLAA